MKCYSLGFAFVHIHFGFVFHAKMRSWKSLAYFCVETFEPFFWIVLSLSLRVRAYVRACASICLSVCLSFHLSITVCTSLRGIQWNIIYSVQKIKYVRWKSSHSLTQCLAVCSYTFRTSFSFEKCLCMRMRCNNL